MKMKRILDVMKVVSLIVNPEKRKVVLEKNEM